ncbi:uncharacterized protein C16orf96 [Gadus morhua]|uniref:uncharacterized protein C16orf96 n=1 Tax=Gadus morhua TaxID=8049 RepID=UPI0011B7BC95|nr:uncharacterized protein C16orf96-like [Gadus morhua]
MSGDISLHKLVDLSIGTPDIGVVNFNALHTLLHAILDHLKIQTVTINWTREEECVGKTLTAPPQEQNQSAPGYQDLEDKLRRIETQIALVENLPSSTELLDRSSASATPVNDMWQLMQLRRHIQTNEDGVSKSFSLVQDLLLEIQELKESRDQLKEKVEEQHTALEKVNSALQEDHATALEECCHRVEQLEATTRSLEERVERCPSPVVLENTVTWEVLQSALLSEREDLHTELSAGAKGPVTDPPSPAGPGLPPSPSPPPTLPPQPPAPCGQVAGGSAAVGFPETLEALRVVGRLSDRHGDLEERVETLEAELARLDDLAKHASGAAGSQDPAEDLLEQMKHLRSQVEGLASDMEKSTIQNKITQLQAEFDRLRETTQHLLENHDEKQTHLQKLYKSMKVLEEQKADKQLLETEIQIKADKCALESKVSLVQLDAATEQLSTMFHNLLSKVTGQEQDWHKVIDRLSSEMEGKLNRMELDSMKKQLEDRWKNIRKKIKSPEHEDNAAGLTRQLVARFHCISCSRPVEMTAPGRFPGIGDYGYVTMSRPCGGHHTVTQPIRRSARFQHLRHFYQAETEALPVHPAEIKLQGEEDILGLAGQIYKGRLTAKAPRTTDQHLPSLSPRESMSKSGDGRVQRSKSQMSCTAPGPGYGAPSRPQSTRAGRRRIGSAGSGRAWPVSAADDLGSLAQSSGELQRRAPVTELHVDLRPPDEKEGPGTNL